LVIIHFNSSVGTGIGNARVLLLVLTVVLMGIVNIPAPTHQKEYFPGGSGGQEGILSELLCAGLCDTMFTVSSTLI